MITLIPTTLQLAKRKNLVLEASGTRLGNTAGWLRAGLVFKRN